jgi:hypothetical protein
MVKVVSILSDGNKIEPPENMDLVLVDGGGGIENSTSRRLG